MKHNNNTDVTEDLYNNLPDAFKELFQSKAKEENKMKKEGKTTFNIIQELLNKIQAIKKK